MTTPDEREDKPAPERSTPSWAAFASMGLTLAVCVAGGLLLGLWADSAAGTSPLFLFLGLVAGCVIAAFALVSLVRRNL